MTFASCGPTRSIEPRPPTPSLSSWVDAVAKTTSPPKRATSEPSPRLEPTGGTSTSHPASASKRPVSAYDVDR